MTDVRFNIEYGTRGSEELMLVDSKGKAYRMTCKDSRNHQVEISFSTLPSAGFMYHYEVHSGGSLQRQEWHGQERLINLKELKSELLEVRDQWRETPRELPYYSSAFLQALFRRPKEKPLARKDKSRTLTLQFCYSCPSGTRIKVCGNQAVLGNWDPKKAQEMSSADFPYWKLTIPSSQLHFPLFFKFLIQDDKTGQSYWQEGEDIQIPYTGQDRDTLVCINDAEFTYPRFRCAGCAVPLFSLRSEGSFGVGDMGDLRLMVNWLRKTHQRILQLLPIYDTTQTHTWVDSYPYNSISIYAIHPMYMDLRQLPELPEDRMAEYRKTQKKLNALSRVDYEAVNKAKWRYMEEVFKAFGEKDMAERSFKDFIKENQKWLAPYAVYSYLRDNYGTPDFSSWPKYNRYNDKEARALLGNREAGEKAAFYSWIQYHLHIQLKGASDYAKTQGVALKGDIPIGISPVSVEAWTEPEYFHFNSQAGAPPDDFSMDGQNWGFPTYDWDVMEKDQYAWWKARLRKMGDYFSAYRVDHILGFFRIWEIPKHSVTGLMGHFSPAIGLSEDAIRGYGFLLDERHLTPSFSLSDLESVFKERSGEVIDTFMDRPEEDLYRFKPQFSTQHAILEHLQEAGEQALELKGGLFQLVSDVLIMRDEKNPGLYHPRIMGQKTLQFERLDPGQKHSYNLLYQDYFFSLQDQLWRSSAMKKLPALLGSTSMLCCAEDLGMIPACVPDVLKKLQILSLEIERMPKKLGDDFSRPKFHPYRSVCTFSTHDMSTLRGWWKEDRQQVSEYYKHVLLKDSWHGIPEEADTGLCKDVIQHTLQGSAMLTIIALQDYLSMSDELREEDPLQERVNVPANPRHYWRYRMPVTLEKLIKNAALQKTILTLIQESQRDNE